MSEFNPREHARYWAGVLYPENMREDWRDCIDEVLQVPYAYAIHDKDMTKEGTPKKTHVHLVIVFGNTTTARTALKLMDELSAPGKKCISTVESVKNIRFMYDYLIHDTDNCRKKGKYQYPESARVTGNGFAIAAYEQMTPDVRQKILIELIHICRQHGFVNYADAEDWILDHLDEEHWQVFSDNSSRFYHRFQGEYQRNTADYEKVVRVVAAKRAKREGSGFSSLS